ncbi:unnamed protein product [Calypogeia fissa]
MGNRYTHSSRYSFLGGRLLSDASNSSKGGGSLLKIFVAIAVGVTCFLALVATAVILYCYRRRRARVPPLIPWTGSDLSSGPNYVMKSPLQDPKDIEMQSSSPVKLSLKEVQTVTEKFKSKIGEGGFGAVYYGTLPNGTAVAVKVRSLNSNQGTREFTAELELLRTIKHENLVPLVGFCTEYQQQILVYPYMSNGSLHDRLYDKSVGRKPLDWLTRLNIVLGAARGLDFLHTGGDRCIIHRDVKSSNILLDDSMKAKIADFGLSKVSPLEDESLVSTEVRGTAEYLDPEYYQTHKLTEMSDVYSFGIVLLETVCGREPLNMNRPRDERSLLEWVRPYIKDANIEQIVDPEIQTYTSESLWRVLEIALQSVEPHSSRRPTTSYIVRELEDALIIENNASQYMASIQSLDSLCIPPNLDLKEFSKPAQPMSYPLTLPFEPSPVFSETMTGAPDPR